MSIVVIDDSKHFKIALKAMLEEAGYDDIILFDTVGDAIVCFQNCDDDCKSIDLILMDIQMPKLNGIEAVKVIKANDYTVDIPIIMVTAQDQEQNIEAAFEAGAIDFINKPLKKIELRARIRSVLKLKKETDIRKEKEKELEEINRKLHQLSITDGLTRLFNRRYFNDIYIKEWSRSRRQKESLSILMCDVDHFKLYNDNYGHQMGDEALIKISEVINTVLKRASDIVARYGGEEFIIMLPNTDHEGGRLIGEKIIDEVRKLKIEHEMSTVSDYVTISAGLASAIPVSKNDSQLLIKNADKALYVSKESGRNMLSIFKEKM